MVIGNYVVDKQFSQLGHAKWLANEMPKEGFDVKLVSPPKIVGGGTGEIGKWRGYVDKYVLFPANLRKASREFDLVHIADHSNVMYGNHSSVPWGVTLHDLIPQRMILGELDSMVRPSGLVLQNWIKKGLFNARWVGCVSQATIDDYVRLIRPDPTLCFLTPDCLYRDFHRLSSSEAEKLITEAGFQKLLSRPFLMHIGGNNTYKNRPGYIRIADELFGMPEFKDFLFIACGKKIDYRAQAAYEKSGLGSAFVEVESAPDDLVLALYTMAQGLIFPSLIEGFGLPVLEAMACGCPVFTSNRRPMTEVGGDAARYFDPESPRDAACTIANTWKDRPRMVEEGYKQVERLSSARSSAAYAAWYRKILVG